jgi:large subunit ribosomal protein L3
MVKGILGKKLGMTQVFTETGALVPVTVIEAGPCVVTQVKTTDTEGYEGLQVAFGDIKEKRVNKPLKGHFAKSGAAPKRHIQELPVDGLEELELGQEIRADIFAAGERVKITGVSKGKGFAGAVKRWHFHGGDAGHGSTIRRKPQSGGATDAARTFKGVKRPGRMGGKNITQRGLTVVRVDSDRNLLLIGGSVPGANGALLMIAKQSVGG